jgi:hypothetical protein
MSLINNFIELFILSSPWLLLGLFIAALINVYLPRDFLNRHLGKEGVLTTIKAALIGAPMPLCSCGVIPAALGLRRAGASKSATTAFLVSTPETGIDSISVSYILLGPFMAIIRPIAAVCSAITAGLLVGSGLDKQNHCGNNDASAESSKKDSCCKTEPQQQEESTSCCASKPEPKISTDCCSAKVEQPTNMVKIKQAFAFSANKLLSDTAKWLVIGLFFAALVQTYVPKDFLLQHGSGIWAMLAVILISIPMYICATASTPIAAGLLLAGVSPGAVLVFMLAGPATNIATLGIVFSELGKRAVAAYLTGVIGVALLFGFLTDYLVVQFNFELTPSLASSHHVLPLWLEYTSGIVLAGLLLRLAWLKSKRLFYF